MCIHIYIYVCVCVVCTCPGTREVTVNKEGKALLSLIRYMLKMNKTTGNYNIYYEGNYETILYTMWCGEGGGLPSEGE